MPRDATTVDSKSFDPNDLLEFILGELDDPSKGLMVMDTDLLEEAIWAIYVRDTQD